MAKVVSISDSLPGRTKPVKVSVAIPALNEARNLPYVASRMPSDVDEIVFVDGHSVDGSAEVARQLWPRAVQVTQTRQGKGNALACGFAAASGDIIVMMDADGSNDPREIPRYIGALISGADFAKGSRFIQGGSSDDITVLRRLGNTVLNGLVNVLFATNYTDMAYGFNAFWRHCLDVISLPNIDATKAQWGDGFEVETLINVRVATSQLRIVEVCSRESARIHGVSNLNFVPDGLRMLRIIQQEFSHRDGREPRRSGAHSGGAEHTAGHGPRTADSLVSPAHRRTVGVKPVNPAVGVVARNSSKMASVPFYVAGRWLLGKWT